MSRYLFFTIVVGILFLLTFSARYLLRKSNRLIWQKKIMDRLARFLPLFTLIIIVVMVVSIFFNIDKAFPFILSAVLLSVLIFISLIISLPLSLLTHKTAKIIKPLNKGRRNFIKGASAALPLFLSSSSVYGFTGSFNKVKIRQVPFYFKNLPPDLIGLKILHLSDLHLGSFFTLSDLEEMIPAMALHKPHLVLITGDIADDLTQLPTALDIINQIGYFYGGFISIGNHEYYRGFDRVVKIFNNGPFPLLLDQGVTLNIGKTPFFIGGLNDPKTLSADNHLFLQKSLEKVLNHDNHSAFKLIMSHRPAALDISPEHNINLLLSGHTHGGQVGFNGKSVFEGMVKEKYLWGKYRKNNTQMYTSAGVGHWLPFRLGCPAEAVIITLKNI